MAGSLYGVDEGPPLYEHKRKKFIGESRRQTDAKFKRLWCQRDTKITSSCPLPAKERIGTN